MIYSTLPGPPLQIRLKRWATPLLLTLTCCTLFSHQMSLSNLAQRLQEQTDQNPFQHLEGKVLGVEQSILAVKQTRNAVTQAALDDLQSALNKRLLGIEQTLTTHVPLQDLQPLLRRLELLESSQIRLAQTPAPKQAKPPVRKPKISAEPAFQILGRELRGAVQFLSVAPIGVQALDQSHLLRSGDTYTGWRLESFDEKTAVFDADGVTHRLSIR